ncbi:MAG: diacylglycerol kinase family protein [Dehalococcoidia bacterium]
MHRAGWTIDVRTTTARGEASNLARMAAAEGFGTVIACGGDGTLREVAEGLAGREGVAGRDAALAVLPAGTANVWAREAGIPLDLAGALALVVRGRRVRIDTGLANGHRFLLMCSAGLDATTVHALEGSRAKRWFGRVAYAAAGIRNAALTPAVATTIELCTEVEEPLRLERDVLMAVVGNSRLFGLVARVTAEARVDDGLLDVCVLSAQAAGGHARGLSHRLGLAWTALRDGLPDAAARGRFGVDYGRATRVRIDSDLPLDVQADGDWIGTTPLEITIEPASLTVVVPWGPNPLWE